MKHLLSIYLLLGLSIAATTVAAEDSTLPGEFSGNVAITTDYVFRGYT